jgi:NitT/TauT family transport system substrate-binding protein
MKRSPQYAIALTAAKTSPLKSLAFGLLLLVTVSCDRHATQASAVKEVRIGYFANLTHAQAVLGVSSGEFAQAVAPATVTTKVFNAGPSLIEALLAGEIDVAYVGPGPVLNAQAKTHGRGIRVIAAAADNGVLIVAREGSGIKTLADLKDKKLATPQHGNTQDLSARHFLKEVAGSDLQNVLPISNAEQSGMMSRGQIDASWAPEPWGSFLVAQDGATVIGEEKDLWPNKEFTLTVVVTTPEFLNSHPDTIESLLRVHRAWTKRLQTEPEKYIPQIDAALFALTNKKLPVGVLPAALKRVKFSDDPLQETFNSYGQWSFELGFSPQKPDLTGLIDTSILAKLEQQEAAAPHKETADARPANSAG